jgi:hypothetical protein
MSNTSRNMAILGVALLAVYLALERITWWTPEWLHGHSWSTFAAGVAWLFLLNIVIFALVGLLLAVMLRGFAAPWLAMLFGLSYGAIRLVLYSFGMLSEALFWLHPLVLSTISVSPLIGTVLGALAFRSLSRKRTYAA